MGLLISRRRRFAAMQNYSQENQAYHRIDWKQAAGGIAALGVAKKLWPSDPSGSGSALANQHQLGPFQQSLSSTDEKTPRALFAVLLAPLAYEVVVNFLEVLFPSSYPPLSNTSINSYQIPLETHGLLTSPPLITMYQKAPHNRQTNIKAAMLESPNSAEDSTSLTAAWTPPSDIQLLRVIRHPCVVVIIGKRGAGKSTLGFRILELSHSGKECYLVGFPSAARKLLPSYIGFVDQLDQVPKDAVALIDESYLKFHSRSSMRSGNRSLGNMISLSRQKNQTLIFVVQEARQLDVNIISQADVLAIKELTDLSKEFERPQLRRLIDKSSEALSTVSGDRRQWTWFYSESTGFEGLLKNEKPTFWTTRLSHAFAQASSDTDSAAPRRGHKLHRDEQRERAKLLRKENFSCQQVADILGVSKTTAWRLIHEDGTTNHQ